MSAPLFPLPPPHRRSGCLGRLRPAFVRVLAVALGFASVCFFAPPAAATTVIPPSFPELVAGADAIYRGTVTAVASRRVPAADGHGSVIKTFVTFAVERTFKGTAQPTVVLEFLGGTVGDERLQVQGMPAFSPGDREFVFVQDNGRQFCPLVALGHGRYRELRDAATGRTWIARDNRLPLLDPTEVALPLAQLPAAILAAGTPPPAAALSPAAFEAAIGAELARGATRPRLP